MKRFGNLYSQIVSKENIRLAHRNARKGKKHYVEVQRVDANEDYYIDELHNFLIEQKFTTSPYTVFKIFEPKERLIYRLPYFPDRIVHHAIMQVCRPIWDKTFIFDSYAAVPGKGIHAGFHRLRCFLRNKKETSYCLKMDISKFYPSIRHDILLDKIAKKIKCKNTLKLLEDIIRSVPGDRGIPIGSYLSQYFSNIYLNDFDHWLKERMRCKYYIRYCDDAVILHNDKRFLHDILQNIERYLRDELALVLNNRTQIFPVDSRGIDFLGYKTFHGFALLRKSSKRNFYRKMAFIEENWGQLKPQHIVSSVMSYVGWLKHCDSYNLLKKSLYENRKLLSIMDYASTQLEITNPISKYNQCRKRG